MRNSRSGAPSNLEPTSSRSSLMFLSVNGTAQSYGPARLADRQLTAAETAAFTRREHSAIDSVRHCLSSAAIATLSDRSDGAARSDCGDAVGTSLLAGAGGDSAMRFVRVLALASVGR